MSSKKIDLKSCEIHLDEEDILHLKVRPNYKVKLGDAQEITEAINKLTRNRKVLELMEGSDFFTFDNEAQSFASRNGNKLFIASAIVSRSSGVVILFNLFKRFYRQPVPFKMFTRKDEALKWLRKQRKLNASS